eukprot:CAMPEP_0114448074 /NCGR_PEP_ID=MMETSP0103-20121206/20122_1 /TAXON_ID=37642 ORGANISM="Paraphysomonas imperforata, Strain PA2" /NCGR_SAMPLE_ID=MMETSP0103 /ASSEMBLY_ACC=CAM_ASM_000201 /LENGTH=262 /DNA_ID=CAMNT_0001620047 /DNA_START=992 /DNA_END=1780 /DNA_ORIENTATION=-
MAPRSVPQWDSCWALPLAVSKGPQTVQHSAHHLEPYSEAAKAHPTVASWVSLMALHWARQMAQWWGRSRATRWDPQTVVPKAPQMELELRSAHPTVASWVSSMVRLMAPRSVPQWDSCWALPLAVSKGPQTVQHSAHHLEPYSEAAKAHPTVASWVSSMVRLMAPRSVPQWDSCWALPLAVSKGPQTVQHSAHQKALQLVDQTALLRVALKADQSAAHWTVYWVVRSAVSKAVQKVGRMAGLMAGTWVASEVVRTKEICWTQ